MNSAMKIKIADIDIFYLSYDEPNKQEHWADIKSKVPWAKWVDGVEGSDAAHKACANKSDTDRFITVDGDNKLVNYDKLIDLELDFSEYDLETGARIKKINKKKIRRLFFFIFICKK